MLTRTIFAVVLFALLKCCHAQPLPVVSVVIPSASGLNTCPTPNYTFGSSNVIWIEASTVSPQDGTTLTSVPNLICSPTITITGISTYTNAGGGSNALYASQVFGTNNVWHLSNPANQIPNSADYVVMAVLKFPNAPSKANTSQDIYRGSTGTQTSGNAFMNYDGSGRIFQLGIQGNGAGFITAAYTDNAAWHCWTFIQSNGVAYIRQDGVQKATGSVANSVNWGGTVDGSWTILGSNAGANFINLEWTRVLMWTNHLSASDLSTYENICTNKFGL